MFIVVPPPSKICIYQYEVGMGVGMKNNNKVINFKRKIAIEYDFIF